MILPTGAVLPLAPQPPRAPCAKGVSPGFSFSLGLSVLVFLGLIGAALSGQFRLFLPLTALVLAWETGSILAIFSAAGWSLRQNRRPRLPGKTPTLAVLIPAWNEAQALPRTLASLLNQSDQPERIIVADDGSTDQSLAVLAAEYGVDFSSPAPLAPSRPYPHLFVLAKAHSGKADSLNQAVALAQEEVVMVLDADTRLYPGAVAAVRRAFAEAPHLHAVAGVPIPACEGTAWGRVAQFFQRYEYLRGFVWYLGWNQFQALTIISGACSAFCRSTLLAAGGYDPNSWTEDCEVIFRLQTYLRSQGQGFRVKIEPQFVAQTEAPRRLGDFLRQRRRWFGGFLETLVQYRVLVGNRRYGVLGVAYLVHATLAIMTPFILLGGSLAGIGFLLRGYFFPAPWGLIFLGAWGFNFLLSAGRLWFYRAHIKRCEQSVWGLFIDYCLAPWVYTPLMMTAQIWGYWSYWRRQKNW